MESYDDILAQALAVTREGQDFEQASQLWGQAYQLLDQAEPGPSLKKAELLQNRAVCCCQSSDFEAAMECCEIAVEQQGELVDDWGDDIQRTLSIYVDAATAAQDFGRALEVSEMALQALAENPEECEPYTFAMVAQKRAYLALQMGEPDSAEEPLAFLLEQLDLFFEMEDLDKDLEREVLIQKASILESRAENRLLGGAGQLGELDIVEAVQCLERAGADTGPIERLRAMQATLSSIDGL